MSDPILPEPTPQSREAAPEPAARLLDYQKPGTPGSQTPESVPWFDYIAVGIALASMLLGLLGFIAAVIWVLR